MLEAGVDILTISRLLGHSSFITTMVYLHVRRQHFDRSPSPIDWLPVRQCPQWSERPEATLDSQTDFQADSQPNTPPTTQTDAAAAEVQRAAEAKQVPAPEAEQTAQPPQTKRRNSGRRPAAKRRRKNRE